MVPSGVVAPPTWVLPTTVKNVHCDALGLGRRRVDAAFATALVIAAATTITTTTGEEHHDDERWHAHHQEEDQPCLTTTQL